MVDQYDLSLLAVSESITDSDLDVKIATSQESLLLLHRSHPEYIDHVQYLAMARLARHRRSHQREDLDKAILHYTEAIFLQPIQGEPFLDIVQTFFRLSLALLERSEDFGQLDRIKYAACATEYLRYIRRFSLDFLDSLDVSRTFVTTSLTRALRTQIMWGAGNLTHDIREMVVLCNELLSSNQSEDVPTVAFTMYLDMAITQVELNRGFTTEILSLILDDIIECLRNAVMVCSLAPDLYEIMTTLANALNIRFITRHSKEDHKEATVLLERILEPGGCPDSFRAKPFSLAIALAHSRAALFGEPEYSEVATSRLRQGSSSPFLGEGPRTQCISMLVTGTRLRFRDYSLDESLEEANSYVSQLAKVSSSSSLAESAELSWSEEARESYSTTDMKQMIKHLENKLTITPPGTKRYTMYLCHLENWYGSKFRRTNDISDLEEAIKYSRLSLDSTDVSDPWRINRLGSLHFILCLAFQKTNKISYLDEAIMIDYDMLELKTARQVYFRSTRMLVSLLLTREQVLGRIEDLHEAIRLISLAIDDQYAKDPERFQLSCEWAILARRIGHPTTLTAYKTAMSLMQKALCFSPTVSVQHARLVAMGENCQTMPLDCASYQIRLGQVEEAVEALEQGRALLWSEMRGLRTPAIQGIGEDSPLVKRFAEINQELENLTVAVTPSGRLKVEHSVGRGQDAAMDPFGRLVIKRKKLVEEQDALILEIQSQPGLEGFLAAPSFDTLRSAASRGPVIIINHCEWRSDIIIVFHNSPPCSIPTTETFFDRAKKLRDELVKARKCGLDSVEYQQALSSVLKGLYELVGEPVIKRLRLLGVPEQSRIWWCPTSLFCSLPLHAMGPIPSSNGRERYFSDLYIPSYTPSLSALIDSRRANPQMPRKPSLLLVAQPDDTLPGVNGEIKAIRRELHARLTVESLVSGEATPSSVLEGLRGSRFAHFACHGELEAGKPFDASFKLYGGSRLTLLDIIRSRLPDAEFAFLSCCHAAEITEDSVADEALHLTAAMQYCGFRSVVGTMWEMADVDGRDLAKTFYKSLFSGQETGVPYYERSAGALRDATQRLREKRGITLERWVNFVHYGA